MKKTLWITLLVATMGASSAMASIIISGNVTDPFGIFTFQITEDISLDIETAGDAYMFVFDEWVTSDSLPVNVHDNPNTASLIMQVNGGSENSYAVNSLFDNYNRALGDVTANDGFLYLDNFIAVSEGGTVTIKAATYTFNGSAGFNDDAVGTFSGNVFLAGSSGLRVSSIEAVPEPATAGLLGISALVLYGLRRIKNFNRA